MRYEYFNANPTNKRVGDCTVRAIATALDKSWEAVYIRLCIYGFMLCDMPSANNVWGAYLKSKGFHRHSIECGDECGYNVRNFCKDNPNGIYILALQSHVICVINGRYFDTWDSGEEVPVYYWAKN